MNQYGAKGHPFLFVIDFEKDHCLICHPDEIASGSLLFNFNGFSNVQENKPTTTLSLFENYPISYAEYYKSFRLVKQQIQQGNSYLVNLTFETPLFITENLRNLYHYASAKYKLLIDDQFLVFSPETFVRIHEGKIASFPMKGTIDAGISHAAEKILADPKEKAEHATIVDLIRNDLSTVANKVEVKRFRFIDKIVTFDKTLLQVSSEICGDLPQNYQKAIGDIIFHLLPAGSITGAPKNKTLEIIHHAETHRRGFYTGICGYFDGENLDSGVMIRFIEQRGQRLFYKSGGGITHFSNPMAEYREYIDKIYVPTS